MQLSKKIALLSLVLGSLPVAALAGDAGTLYNKVLRGLVAGVCAGMSGAVFAADAGGTDKLGEVVVTATKTAKDTMDAPATVSVVTAKDIEKKRGGQK